MLWTLTRKELLGHLLTLRMALVLAFAVVLSVLTAVMGRMDYAQSMDIYRAESQQYEQQQEEVTVYSQFDLRYFLPPQPLAILARGASEASGAIYSINMRWEEAAPHPLRSNWNDRIRTLVRLDFTGAVALLLSFLAVVLGFDGICGERERGTLQQVLANPVPRGVLVAAKLLGGLIILWMALSLGL